MFPETNQSIVRMLNALGYFYLENEKHKVLSPLAALMKVTRAQFFSELSKRTAETFFANFPVREAAPKHDLGVFFDATVLQSSMLGGRCDNLDFICFASLDPNAARKIVTGPTPLGRPNEWHTFTETQDAYYFTVFLRHSAARKTRQFVKVGAKNIYTDQHLRSTPQVFEIGHLGTGILFNEIKWRSKEHSSIHLNLSAPGYFDRGVIADPSGNTARHFDAAIGVLNQPSADGSIHSACALYCNAADNFLLKVFPAWSATPQKQASVGLHNEIEVGLLQTIWVPL